MNTRERFQAVMSFKPFDRLPIVEWAGWWDKTIDRWHGEGLPVELTDGAKIREYFGQDIYRQDWPPPRTADCPKPAAHGAGIIETEDDYEEILEHLFPANSINIDGWTEWAAEQQEGKSVLWLTVDGFFWFARKLLGIEKHLFAFYDQPELMHRINADLTRVDTACN